MSRARRLATHIERAMDGPMWHGPALKEALEGMTHEHAAAKPVPNAHTAWELVLHAAAWAEIARDRLKGQRTGDPSADEDWPVVTATSAADWQQARDRLRASHRLLAEVVRELGDDALDAKVAGLEYSVDVLLHGVIEHSCYHGGQIMLLRKMTVGQ